MRSLFLLCLCCIASSSAAQDTAFIREVLQKWKNAEAYTLEVAEAMPSEQYGFQPMDEERTFSGQLVHMAQNMTWLAGEKLSGKKFEHPLNKKETLSPAEVLELLKVSFAYARDVVANLPPEQLSEKVDFFAGPMSKRQIILLMHDHLTHHRGQLIVYLRLNGIKPPRYRGW
ncbi:MAG: DinB family protein [Lewinellaceae bacterium]|nr:DinB family protein [Saprospiraceae bacterium]MCB0543366.1 DinB family protein [Saprospiraceae bacterium]MCB9355362.1 DinB family protein [Lewinellaceae bacterium]